MSEDQNEKSDNNAEVDAVEYKKKADRLHEFLVDQMNNRPPYSFDKLQRFASGDYEKEKEETKVYGIGYPDIEPF